MISQYVYIFLINSINFFEQNTESGIMTIITIKSCIILDIEDIGKLKHDSNLKNIIKKTTDKKPKMIVSIFSSLEKPGCRKIEQVRCRKHRQRSGKLFSLHVIEI